MKSLTDIDFIINPYDPCVANKIIEGEQMTICFHVDDCKLSHHKKTVMDQMIGYLRQEEDASPFQHKQLVFYFDLHVAWDSTINQQQYMRAKNTQCRDHVKFILFQI
jgi:hypothetical protein